MFYAINTKRNYKQYKSTQVFNDLSLQETENNRWIAPESEIEDRGTLKDGEEVELTYISLSSVFREDLGIMYQRAPYFKLKKYKNGVKLKKPCQLHSKVQDFLFNYIYNNQDKILLTTSEKVINNSTKAFYYTKLSELGLDLSTLDSEITIKTEDNKKRADVFVEINNKNEIYGKALCIEIQLTPQNKETIEERTYKRALLGMSTIWITKNDLNIENKDFILKKDEFVIYPYINVLNKHYEKAQQVLRLEYEKQGVLLDNKIEEIEKRLENLTMAGTLCPKCKIGILEVKKPTEYNRIKNKFLGCTNYPSCNFSANLE